MKSIEKLHYHVSIRTLDLKHLETPALYVLATANVRIRSSRSSVSSSEQSACEYSFHHMEILLRERLGEKENRTVHRRHNQDIQDHWAIYQEQGGHRHQ